MVESPGWPPRNLACLSPCGSTYLGKLFGFTYQGNRTITRCSNATIYCRESGMFFMLASLTEAGGLDSKKAMYVGGTVASVKERTEGVPSTTDEKVFVFAFKDGDKESKLTVPYDRINNLEYGQKAGRRLGLALTVSPWLLLSKKRKHFLTVGYQDGNDKQQAAVFELGKDIVRTMLASMEARTGKKIDCQDDEARKSSKGN